MVSETKQDPVYIPYAGPTLLATSLLNKGTAFTPQERYDFNLTGLIPHHFETIEQQAERAYLQYQSFLDPINKHIYLRSVQDTNETLFYYLLTHHLQEMMPIIYTPTVGEACQRFSEIYRRARGLFISYPERHQIEDILHNATKKKVKVIVVTDGSRILGLGDQGVGGMGIPIGKLSLYTACAGISPAYTLPILLDVGTDNEALLNDPMYIGWKHRRIDDKAYDEFIELFIQAVNKRWPNVLLQFEDFEQKKALPLLQRYQQKVCCFNDDIQGTAAVTVGSLLAACQAKNETLTQQRIVFAGAGAAGCGIAEQLIQQMCLEGLTETAAKQRIYMVDKAGLLLNSMSLPHFQQRLAQPDNVAREWGITGLIDLQTVIEQVKPTILIGVSGQTGLFNETLIKTLYQYCPQPIIFPLSNPSSRIEATPEQLLNWTEGQALVATGSPFMPVKLAGKTYAISQCNNSYIFPAIGLAVVAGQISRITDEMMMTASHILAAHSPLVLKGEGALLPELADSAALSKKMAKQVIDCAINQGLSRLPREQIETAINRHFWTPHYRHYQRVSI